MDLKALKQEIPYQWRVQSFSKFKAEASCVAYIDARDVMELLDQICGPENWQSDYKAVDGQMFAGIGIYGAIKTGNDTFREDWVWKWDTGSESNIEAEKGQASDSFKRAAVKWGIGRFLYDLPIKKLAANEVKGDKNFPYPIDASGARIWDLSKHINSVGNAQAKPLQRPASAKPLAPSKLVAPTSVVNAKTQQIKDLVNAISLNPVVTVGEYKKYIQENAEVDFTEENYDIIIERLEKLLNKETNTPN